MKYESPESGKKAFTCPHCGVLARQYHFSNSPDFRNNNTFSKNDPIRTSVCEFCGFFCIWHNDELVYPNRGNAPAPNAEMPVDVKKDYEEAASISNSSPRGAAALLRLAIQKLAKHLGGKGDNLNNDIELLLNNGLPVSVQKALDIVRVIGNNAVHPGQIDVDNPDVVSNLFSLVNVISEYMISMPNRISTLYEDLPEDSKKSITKRNSKDKKTA